MTIDKSQFEGWRALLKGEKVQLYVNSEDAMSGYFRLPHTKGGLPDRVAIWRDSEAPGVQCMWGDELVNIERVWPYAAKYPIEYTAYVAHFNTGQWPDNHVETPRAPGPGDNNPPTDPAEVLAEQIASASAGVKDYATITDDNHLAQSQTLRGRLLELSRNADTVRKERKKPHQDKADEVDEKFMPLVKNAKAAADKVNAAQNAYATQKIRDREAAERVLEEKRVELEAKGVRVPDFAPPPPLATQVRGAVGKAANIGGKVVVKSVTDWPALFAHFSGEDEVRKALVKLANIAVGMGQTVPGVETEAVGKVK